MTTTYFHLPRAKRTALLQALGDRWRFADAIHQIKPTHVPARLPMAPSTSLCLFVRPDDGGQKVDVGRTIQETV